MRRRLEVDERLDFAGRVLEPLDEGSVIRAIDRLTAEGVVEPRHADAAQLQHVAKPRRGDEAGLRALALQDSTSGSTSPAGCSNLSTREA
jgi:hypothetical protein